MDSIELADFASAFDRARASESDDAAPIRYTGHLLLPGDDVVISAIFDDFLDLKINGEPADKNHPMASLVRDCDVAIRRALKRNLKNGVIRSEIVGRWHENGEEYAFEPYLVRNVCLDRPPILFRYRYRIFPLDGFGLSDRFSVDFDYADHGERAKRVLETSTEMNIHYDELPKTMFTWMPVGVVWSPPRKSGFPVLVEYAVGTKKRGEMRKTDVVASGDLCEGLQAV